MDWIGPLFALGAASSGPVAFFLLNKIGRKKTLFWMSTPMLVGYILLTLSKKLQSIAIVLVGRFLVGNKKRFHGLICQL